MGKITASSIQNYLVCPRKFWLNSQNIGMEHTSELIQIGTALHEAMENVNKEVKIDHIIIDRITKKYVVEMKKTDAHREASRWQLLYYLHYLKSKGVEKEGMLEFKSAEGSKREYVTLTEELEGELLKMIDEMTVVLNLDEPPKVENIKACGKCSYREYCFV